MARWPTSGAVYPVTPKAYPTSALLRDYPGTLNSFPAGSEVTNVSGTFTEGSDIDLIADETYVGSGMSVEFFGGPAGTTSISTDSSGPPWTATDAAVQPGSKLYRIKVDSGAYSVGTAITITAQAPTITEPDPGESINIGTNFTLTATTFDDTVTTGVSFAITGPAGYSTTVAGSLAAGVWSGSWNTTGRTAGSYSITATRTGTWGSVASGATSFSLTSIPDFANLVSWVDWADTGAITLSGTDVTAYADKGSSAAAWTAASNFLTYQATGFTGGLPCVDMDGVTNNRRIMTTDAEVVALFTNGAASTTYIVCEADVPDSITFMFGWGNSGQAAASSGGYGFDSAGSGHWMTYTRNDANTVNNDGSASTPPTATKTAICVFRTTAVISISENDAAADPNAASQNPGALTPNRVSIGNRPVSTPDLPFNGRIAEILCYSGTHDATTRGQVFDYIQAKWGTP